MSSLTPTVHKRIRRASCEGTQFGSHHALNTAYQDLKNRLTESEKNNKLLNRKVHELQHKVVNNVSHGYDSSILDVKMTACGTDAKSNDVNMEAVSLHADDHSSSLNFCRSLETQNHQLHQSNQELSGKVIELQERCHNIEIANEDLSVQNIRLKEEVTSLKSSYLIRENDHVEKNVKFEQENDTCLMKIVSLEKKLKFTEKQLGECKAVNVKQRNHDFDTNKVIDELFEESSEGFDDRLFGTIVHKFSRTRVELDDCAEIMQRQQTIIQQLIRREEDRSNVLLSQKDQVSMTTASRSSSQHSFGARPKQNRNWQRATTVGGGGGTAVACTEDVLKEGMGLPRSYQYTLYSGELDKASLNRYSKNLRMSNCFRKSESETGLPDAERIDNCMSSCDNPDVLEEQRNFSTDRLRSWLGQLPQSRHDSLEHLHDDSPDEDYLADLENINTADDFDQADEVDKNLLITNFVSTASDYNTASRSIQPNVAYNSNPSSPRHSVQSPIRVNSSSNIPVENIDPSLELENRYRPNSSFQLPRPLNIERNQQAQNMPKSYDNNAQNLNLLLNHEKNDTAFSQQTSSLFLNNDPLIGHKNIPNKNIYRDDVDKMDMLGNETKAAVDSSRICPICHVDFHHEITMEDFQQHVLDCCESPEGGERPSGQTETVRVCPVCSEHYPDSISQVDYESHVNGHFDEDLGNLTTDAFGTMSGKN